MREGHVGLFRKWNARVCSVTIEPSNVKHSSGGLRLFTARNFQKSEADGRYCETLVYQDLSLRKHTRKLYGDEALRVAVPPFSEYALQFRYSENGLSGLPCTSDT